MNNSISFVEYVEEFLDMHIALMSDEQIKEARADFTKFTANAAKRRAKLSDAALEARAVAKMFGGKALKGTAKQKEWAEKIRAEAVRQMPEKQALLACDPKSILNHSKFWIENRAKSGAEIGAFIEKSKSTLKEYRAAVEAGDKEDVAALAKEYNSLNEAWGF